MDLKQAAISAVAWAWDNRDILLTIATLAGGLTKSAWIVDGLKFLGAVVPKKGGQ